jgi:ABC-type glycerol-3-phosphate transport system substrate-binding protein
MSITSCASDPDLAWEFIRYMLGTDAQQYMASNMDTLPVNKSAFDAISQEQIALSKEVHDHYLEDPEAFSSEPIAITSEQKDELSKLISSVDNTAHIDSEIQAAIFDEVDRYFNDYVPLDEFCKAIQAKASEIMKNR